MQIHFMRKNEKKKIEAVAFLAMCDTTYATYHGQKVVIISLAAYQQLVEMLAGVRFINIHGKKE
jgi:hypothetical protein